MSDVSDTNDMSDTSDTSGVNDGTDTPTADRTPTPEEVDAWFGGMLLPRDDALEDARRASDDAGLPSIAVSALQGRFLAVLARAVGARRVLEIGTLGGYSTIAISRGLPPDGRVTTLEADPHHAAVARDNLARAGLAEAVEVIEGDALDVLPRLAQEAAEMPFDLAFIDADKQRMAEYVDWAVRLGRPGTLIVVDNVVRGGRVALGETGDDAVDGVRRFVDLAARDPRLMASALQTVGAKGHDGLAVCVVTRGT